MWRSYCWLSLWSCLLVLVLELFDPSTCLQLQCWTSLIQFTAYKYKYSICSPHLLCGLLAVPDLLHGGELHLGDGGARPAPDVGHQILGRPAVTSHLMLTLLNIYLLLYAVNGTVERRPHFIIKFRKFLLVDSSNVIVPTWGWLPRPASAIRPLVRQNSSRRTKLPLRPFFEAGRGS